MLLRAKSLVLFFLAHSVLITQTRKLEGRSVCKFPLFLIIIALTCPHPAWALIVGGTATKISPPAIVGKDNFNTSTIFAFDERQNVLLASPLSADAPISTLIPGGALVNSHY